MSLISSTIQGGLGGFAKGGVGGIIGGALGGLLGGGNGGPNIARSLSKQVGCTILQRDANQARALLSKGIDPCTGQNQNAISTATSFDVGIPTRTTTLLPEFAGPGAGAVPIPINGTTSRAIAPGGGVVAGGTGGALEFTSTGLIRNVIVNGRRVSRRNAASFIRKAGMEVGARGLGLSLQQAAQVVLQQSTRPRRRRGISGKQITEAKRVINTIKSMSKALGCSTPRRAAPRKTSCR